MIFASFEFLFLFLPLFTAVYFATPDRFRNWPILVLSWAFYAWWRVDFLALLAGVTLFTFVLAAWMDRHGPRTPAATRLLWVALVGNLGVLAYFKYANFGVETFNQVIAAAGFTPMSWTNIVLPVGLSFYVLQSVSYAIDVWRGDIRPTKRFVDYAAYKALFSQLIAGPIVRYAEIAEMLRHRAHSLAQFGAGARRFMVGFAMKVLIADTLSPVVDAAFALPEPTLADAWLGAVAYTLQLFFDFAGYSAMAIGLALLYGFRFPENFNHPYLARSIQEFWQRWHMTLSRFLRDYLYIPLGGNRLGPVRTYVNLMLTMVIGGFWHGANWTFILWGFWHGLCLSLHRAWNQAGFRMAAWIALPLTLLVAILGWVPFRAHDLASAFVMLGGMAGLHGVALSDALAWQVAPDQWWCLWIAIGLVFLPLGNRWWPWARPEPSGLWRVAVDLAPLAGFALSLVALYSRAAAPFLYFQF